MSGDMRVLGIVVPSSALNAARTYMGREGVTSEEIARVLIRAGVPMTAIPEGQTHWRPIAIHAAQRFLQAERRAGRATFAGGYWCAVKAEVRA